MAERFVAIPLLMLSAPFIIMRNTVRGSHIERRRFKFVMMPPSLPACGA
jgi:hypothetical protein